MTDRRPLLTDAELAELAAGMAAGLSLAVERLAGNYGNVYAELAELRDELHALSNRIEAVHRAASGQLIEVPPPELGETVASWRSRMDAPEALASRKATSDVVQGIREMADHGTPEDTWNVTEPVPGWTVAGPYAEAPTFRVFERTAEGHRYAFGHDSYDGAAAGATQEWRRELPEALHEPDETGLRPVDRLGSLGPEGEW